VAYTKSHLVASYTYGRIPVTFTGAITLFLQETTLRRLFGERHVDRLVKRAVRGDAEAFGAIFDIYADRVYGYIRVRVGTEHDAEDIAGTVFLKAFEAMAGYRQTGAPFSAWLFRIAHNAIVDHHRRNAKVPEPVEDIESYTEQDPVVVDEVVLAKVDAEMMKASISKLTSEQAAVVVARFIWDMDVRSTAKVLDRTENAVKALQHRAMKRLARIVEEHNDES